MTMKFALTIKEYHYRKIAENNKQDNKKTRTFKLVRYENWRQNGNIFKYFSDNKILKHVDARSAKSNDTLLLFMFF